MWGDTMDHVCGGIQWAIYVGGMCSFNMQLALFFRAGFLVVEFSPA